jgi:hypothetical protein
MLNLCILGGKIFVLFIINVTIYIAIQRVTKITEYERSSLIPDF